VAKPSDAFYVALEEATGKKKSEIIYIDDKKENVDAALKRGWHGIVFNASHKVIPQVKALLGLSSCSVSSQ